MRLGIHFSGPSLNFVRYTQTNGTQIAIPVVRIHADFLRAKCSRKKLRKFYFTGTGEMRVAPSRKKRGRSFRRRANAIRIGYDSAKTMLTTTEIPKATSRRRWVILSARPSNSVTIIISPPC